MKGEESPHNPASRPVCGQDRKEGGQEREKGSAGGKLRFFSPIPSDFRRIYFQAGISVAVTSARNSGQIGFVARF